MQPSFSEFPPHITERQHKILGWPTDTLSIDFLACSDKDDQQTLESPHTVLILIPGNPGQYDWYVNDLCHLVQRLGRGYAARAISHAGHSLRGQGNEEDKADDSGILNVEEYAKQNPDANPSIPWTIEGQVQHKCAYMEQFILSEFPTTTTSFIFLGHSFGCYVVQQLCLLRPNILSRTLGFLYLMPFIRMKADAFHQAKLDWGAHHPKTLIAVGTAMSSAYRILPKALVNAIVKMGIRDDKARDIAVQLLRQPTFVRNFFTLGSQEIRDIPKDVDIQTLNILAKSRPIFMLFAGNDQWAPTFHMADIARLQAKNMLSGNIFMTYLPELRHDYVSHERMPLQVVGWCYQCITSLAMHKSPASESGDLKNLPTNKYQLRAKL